MDLLRNDYENSPNSRRNLEESRRSHKRTDDERSGESRQNLPLVGINWQNLKRLKSRLTVVLRFWVEIGVSFRLKVRMI